MSGLPDWQDLRRTARRTGWLALVAVIAAGAAAGGLVCLILRALGVQA